MGILFLTVCWSGAQQAQSQAKPQEAQPLQGQQEDQLLLRIPDVIVTGENESLLASQGKKEALSDTLLNFDLNQVGDMLKPAAPGGLSVFDQLNESRQERENYTRLNADLGTGPQFSADLLHAQEKAEGNLLFDLHDEALVKPLVNGQNDQSQVFNGIGQFGYNFKDHQELNGDIEYMNGRLDLPYGATANDRQQKSEFGANLNFKNGDDVYSFDLQPYLNVGHRDTGEVTDDSGTYGLKDQFYTPLYLGVAFPTMVQQQGTLRWDNINTGPGSSQEVFAQLNADLMAEPVKILHLSVGANFTAIQSLDNTESRLFPEARIVYDLSPRARVFLAYQPVLEVPTFEELYFDKPYTKVSPSLYPEESYNVFEQGMQGAVTRDMDFSYTVFWKETRGFINLSGPDQNNLWTPYNLTVVKQQGIRVRLGWQPFTTLDLGLKYEGVQFNNCDSGDAITYSPSSRVGVSGVWDDKTWEVDLDGSWADSRYYNLTGGSLTPYWLANLTVKRKDVVKGLTLWLKGENLLGQSYQLWQGYEEPGATALVGLTWVMQ